ncbi:MAG: CdvA-like protein [Candidatus Nitrosopelagicus sp.]|nr:CdvA-like protein [Candidatus Nitrosopelagicus sp.]
MTKNEAVIIGRQVKDMYGTLVGKVLGTLTDIDGSVQTVGVDCGSEGLKQIQYEQLVLQEDVVIYIPKWRLQAQKFLREKGLTIRRINALEDIVSENGEMKDDAEIIHNKYKSKLASLDQIESKIKTELLVRSGEIEDQEKVVKEILFDAKVQIKSEEITESTFGTIQTHANNILERFSHEKAEIDKVQNRIDDLSLEHSEAIENPKQYIQQSAMTYLDSPTGTQSQTFDQPMSTSPEPESTSPEPESTLPEPESTLPEPPVECADSHTPVPTANSNDPDWLSRIKSEEQA